MTSASAIQIDKKVYIVSPIKKYILICGQWLLLFNLIGTYINLKLLLKI
jgi:hypothetical protein